MSGVETRAQIAVAQRVAVAGIREATKNVGKQVVKAHLRASGKVVSSYLRVAPRGAARFIPGGIGLTISVLDAAYSMYSLYSAVKDTSTDEPLNENVVDQPEELVNNDPDDDEELFLLADIPLVPQNISNELPPLFR